MNELSLWFFRYVDDDVMWPGWELNSGRCGDGQAQYHFAIVTPL